MRITIVFASLLTVVLAKDLATAKALAKAGKIEEAAAAFGVAAAAAQKQRDLVAEQKIAEALAAFLDGLPPEPTAKQKVSASMATAAIVSSLNPGHRGVFVSRTALIRESLYDATRTGVFRGVGRYSVLYRGRGKNGDSQAREIVAQYAQAISRCVPAPESQRSRAELDEDDTKILVASLREAQQAAIKRGFVELTMHITTEMVAILAHIDPKEAEKCLRRATATLAKEPDLELLIKWSGMLRARLGKNNGPYAAIVASKMEGATRPPAGTGSAGGTPGGPQSALGVAWRRFRRGAPFLTIKRDPKGFTVVPKFKRAREIEVVFKPGERVRRVGGVHILFHGSSAAVQWIELKEKEGFPAESSHRSRWRAYYLLANDETMTVSTKGVAFKRR